jgi:hypothetical protein
MPPSNSMASVELRRDTAAASGVATGIIEIIMAG